MIVGYGRVSTDGQALDTQHAALIAAGAERVFAERLAGWSAIGRRWQRRIAALGAGDVLLVRRGLTG